MRQIILAMLIFLIAPVLQAQEKLIFSTFSSGSFNVRACQQVLREAYGQLNIDIDFDEVPGARALELSNMGTVDGEVFRIANLNQQYPSLIMIPVVIGRGTETVFVKDLDLDFKGWESLRPYTIGVQIGAKSVERGTMGMNTVPVAEFVQLFEMLDKGRVDVIIATRLKGREIIKKLNLQGIKMLDSSSITRPFYHYLHQKNRELVPKITNILKTMEANGEIVKIRNQVEQTILVKH